MDGFGLADRPGREPHAECTLDSQDEFGSTQAIDAQIALDAARRTDVDESGALRMQFAHESGHDRNQVTFAQLLPGNFGRQI